MRQTYQAAKRAIVHSEDKQGTIRTIVLGRANVLTSVKEAQVPLLAAPLHLRPPLVKATDDALRCGMVQAVRGSERLGFS